MLKKTLKFLNQFREEKRLKQSCIYCGSSNIELVSTPRKIMNWISAITTFFLGDYAMTVEKVYHCFDCKREFKEPLENEIAPD